MVGLVIWGLFDWFNSSNDEFNRQKALDVEDEVEKEDTQVLEDDREKIKGVITEDDLTHFQEQGLNPFGTEEKISELKDVHYKEFIHGMSHQKVRAKKKWGFYELHPARIQWLLNGLNEIDLKHEDIYEEILRKWEREDFSEIDKDHNAIWKLQGGNVGKATGILSPEEEQDYIESHH